MRNDFRSLLYISFYPGRTLYFLRFCFSDSQIGIGTFSYIRPAGLRCTSALENKWEEYGSSETEIAFTKFLDRFQRPL